MESPTPYHEPLALVIISSISLGLGVVAALCIAFDIFWRRGWKSMMAIMIPVYIINALYLWPITLWTYFTYGRPPKPVEGAVVVSHCASHRAGAEKTDSTSTSSDDEAKKAPCGGGSSPGEVSTPNSDDSALEKGEPQRPAICCKPESGKPSEDDHAQYQQQRATHEQHHTYDQMTHNHTSHSHDHNHHHADQTTSTSAQLHCHSSSSDRPLFATITIAVTHCGAGCVLGDIVGEWLIYSTNLTISGRSLWPAYLLDFAFAFAFGVFFQYFSIAPMAGNYSPKILIRALKADALSLIFFEIGLFAWMAIFQIAIFDWRLEMTMVTYWWMMQIGMVAGHWTGMPVNWWLIRQGIKEPCA